MQRPPPRPTLSLHDALPISARAGMRVVDMRHESGVTHAADAWARIHRRPALSLVTGGRSEEHTSELQSRQYLVCRLLLEKKNGPLDKEKVLDRFQAVTEPPN